MPYNFLKSISYRSICRFLTYIIKVSTVTNTDNFKITPIAFTLLNCLNLRRCLIPKTDGFEDFIKFCSTAAL
jgi:hypothetical protein